MLNILIVDDEPDLCAAMAETLVDEGHRVSCASDGAQAVVMATGTAFDVVLADVRLPKVDGLTLFRRLRLEAPATDLILMTGDVNVSDAVAALKEGAFDYLTKPVQLDELKIQLARIASYRALHQEVVSAREELLRQPSGPQALVGHSPQMQRLIKRIDTMAHSHAPVVITGESGTGKELVAHALHERGPRAASPFVAVNCAAFPEALIESELFGHERGAFTGATGRREGRLKAAHGGTLFLDEVAELSLPAQTKLLRAVQEGTFEPLGSNESIRVDVRIISATHQNLKQRIADGLFREDLYYRINTLDLDIPPLRERRGDLALLVQLFIQRFSRPERPTTGMTWRAWNALAAHPFPGNVRELMHTIQHGVLLSPGGKIDLEHLPASFRGLRDPPAPGPSPPESQLPSLGEATREFERAYLVRALAEFEGRRAPTAESLGISRKNLWEKLRMHGISSPERNRRPNLEE